MSRVYRNDVGRLATDCPLCGQMVVCHRRGEGYEFHCYGGHTDDEVRLGLDPLVMIDLGRAENGTAPAEPLVEPLPAGPLSLPLDKFLAHKGEPQIALLGDDDDCLMAKLGLGLFLGRGGKGKTTALNDLALHAAAGVDWCGIAIPRPVRVLVVENEGPQEPYRRKLERRHASWTHELSDRLHINVANWASFRLDAADGAQRLREECERLQIELVLADPLDSFGMEGEGTPSEVRRMVDLMKLAGFASQSAWFVVHHPGKTQQSDLVDQASGAWGPKPDLMLLLEKLDGNRARLSFPKTRWATTQRAPVILAFVPDSEAFEFVAEDVGDERDLAAEVFAFLGAHPLRTTKEVAAKTDADPPGIGANEKAVKQVLEGDPERFDSITGEAAKAAGRSSTAILWTANPEVSRASDSPDAPSEFPGEEKGESGSPTPRRGGDPDSPTPPPPHKPESTPDSPHLDPVAEADRIAAKFKRPNPKGGSA